MQIKSTISHLIRNIIFAYIDDMTTKNAIYIHTTNKTIREFDM